MSISRFHRSGITMPLLLLVATACTSSKSPPDPVADVRTRIDALVADDARAARMQDALDQLEAALGEADRLFADERASLAPLIRDYSSSRGDFERMLADFNSRHESVARRFLAAHAALKAEATEAEWRELRKLEMETIRLAASRSVGETAPFRQED